MAKLIKVNSVKQLDDYKITITSSLDTDTFFETYNEKNPENDNITQMLFYAHKHNWQLTDEYDHNFDLLMNKVDQFLSDEQLIDLNLETFKSNLHDFVYELTGCIPSYIEYIKIEKDGKEYDLKITDFDIYNIFKELAEID